MGIKKPQLLLKNTRKNMTLKEIGIDFFKKYKETEIYYLVDKQTFVAIEIIKEFKDDKKVLLKKIVKNQYDFSVEVIQEKLKNNNK